MLIPVTRHFACIEDVLPVLEEEVDSNRLRNFFRLGGIEYLWTADGTLVPSITSPFSSPYLYRGQVKRYQPCVPAVFRGLEQVDRPSKLRSRERARCFGDRVKLEEFVLALAEHPASSYAREIGLRMHPYALAQHYGLATDRLDLTQDHWVAAFFATNALESGSWQPVRSGEGILYRIHARLFTLNMPDSLECIGKQALPRPGEQKGYALTLPLGCDFENLPVEIFTFSHDESCGRRLNERFAAGSALFPPDVMAEIAQAIKSASSVPLSIAQDLFGPHDRLDNFNYDLLEGIEVSPRQPIVMNAEQRTRALDTVACMRKSFQRNVGGIAVRRAAGQTRS